MVMILSLTIFATDIAGITMIVRAGDYSDEAGSGDSGDNDDGGPGGSDESNESNESNDPNEQPDDPDEPDDPDDPTPAPSPADDEAAKKAEEEAAAAAKAAEAAAKAAEEAANDYSLIVTMNGAQVPGVDLGSAPSGQARDYIDLYVTNTGATPFDLMTTKSGDADGAFSLTIKGDMVHYDPGDSGKVSVSMRPDLPVGDYSATFLFGAKSDPSFSKAVAVQARGTVSPGPGVTSVQVSPSHVVVAKGSSWTFSANVQGTGQFDPSVRWSLTGGTDSNINRDNGVLTVGPNETDKNMTVTATSVADSSKNDSAQVEVQPSGFTVNTKADPDNGGRVTGGGHVRPGGSVTLSAVPNTNYVFKGWSTSTGQSSTDTNFTISNIQSDMDVVAKFSRNTVSVTLNVNDSDGGKVSGGGTYNCGDTATIKAKAYDGYTFIGWKEGGDIVSRDSEVKLKNLTVDRTLKAEFKRSRYTVNLVVNPSNAGDVTGGGSFSLGDSTTVKATPRSGYDFTGWYVNGQAVSRDREYRIGKIEQDYTLTANFQQQGITTYEISSGVATTGGSVSPSGMINVAKGSNITYTITPKSGFAILAVAVDGTQIGPVSSYTFSDVSGPHRIAAAFVQTDAGKKAAESSGVKPQETKVEVIPKTETNTATNTSTISINEAANGEGGDNYVEDMNLDDVHVPSDEELGITGDGDNQSDDQPDTDVTRMMGKSFAEVDDMIHSGNTLPILDAAFYTGHLATHVVNAFEPSELEGVDYNKMTEEQLRLTPDSRINPSFPNLDTVVEKMLSTDEVEKLARGDNVDISISLTGLDSGDEATKKLMENAVGKKPVKFFDLTMLKTVDGFTQKVAELPTAMEVIMEVPEEVYKSGENYVVLRVHEGELSVLPNLSDNPREIRFRTDRFSSYAIAREITSANSIVAWLFAGAALALGIAITCFLILVAHHRKMRRMKRNAAHAAHH